MAKAVDSPEVLERFEQQLELVEIIVRQLARSVGPSMELDDLRSFGREGLWEAARRFDPERGVPFKAYANFRVKGAVIDGVRATGRLPRRVHARLFALQAASQYSEGKAEDAQVEAAPGSTAQQAHEALGTHLAAMATAMATGFLSETVRGEEGERVSLAPEESPEEALGRAQLLHLVRDAIQELPEQEAELVRRHYLGGERFDHVADDLGLSKSWASRLHSRALERLTKRLRSHAA
ncbi:MAG: sigma-70 family RNA polymerase sigma factor [Polyangiaceae bacterium]|nr:sigma-70 family RNA polymerase sigma factor [Polyangiaceae bacterium]